MMGEIFEDDIDIIVLKKFYSKILLGEKDKSEYLQNHGSSLEKLLRIESLVNEGKNQGATDLWKKNFRLFENFPTDVVRIRLAVALKEYQLALRIQVKWQIILDKFEKDPIIELYLGLYYYNLGLLFQIFDEYEISANYFGKADSYFKEIKFPAGQYLTQDRIATSYIELGAYGDARYHLRDIFHRNFDIPDWERYRNLKRLGEMYTKSGLVDQANAIYEQILEEDNLIFTQNRKEIIQKIKELKTDKMTENN